MSLSWPEVTFGWLLPGCRLYIRKEGPHLGPLKSCTVRGVTSGLQGDAGPRCSQNLHAAQLLLLLSSSLAVCVP